MDTPRSPLSPTEHPHPVATGNAPKPHSPASPDNATSEISLSAQPDPVLPDPVLPEPDPNFDPTTVPAFPVITVEITPAGELHVDGRNWPLDGAEPVPTAVTAAATIIRQRGLRHSRVAGHIDGQRWLFVVDEHGRRYDLDTNSRTGRATTPRRRAATPNSPARKIAILGGFGLVCILVLTLVIAGLANLVTGPSTTDPTEAPIPPSAELPALPPPGWTTHADWAITTHADSNIRVVRDTTGRITTLTDDRTLTAVDPITGQEQWRGTLADRYTAGPWRTTIDGQPVIAVQTSTTLDWWPAAGGPLAGSTPVPAQAELDTAGTTPLIVLPDQQALIPAAAGPHRRTIPAGATPLRADGTTVTALDTTGRLWQVTTDQVHTPEPTTTLPRPDGYTGANVQLVGTAAGFLLVTLTTDTTDRPNLTALYSLDGRLLASIPTARPGSEWIANEHIAGTGNLVINLATGATATLPDTINWSPVTAAGTTLWGSGNNSPAVVTVTGALTPAPVDSLQPADVDEHHAYVLWADSNNTTRLYALPPG